MREDLKPEDKAKIAGWNLSDIVKQFNIPVGKVTGHGKDIVTINETDNRVGASLKMLLSQFCIVETYVEVHPKLNKNLGPIARGG